MIVLQALFFLIVFGCLLFLAVITTRYLGDKARKTMKGQYINIIETVSLGMDKKIHLIRVGEQFVLVASSGKSVEFLAEVDLANYEGQAAPDSVEGFDFKSFFDKYLQNFKAFKGGSGASAEKEAKVPVEPLEGDVFKGNLNRLKNITAKVNKFDHVDGDDYTNEK